MAHREYKSHYPIRDNVSDRFNITLLTLYSGDTEVATIRTRRIVSGGFSFSVLPAPAKEDQVFVNYKGDLIELVSKYIKQYTDELSGCDVMLIGEDHVKICDELKDKGILIDGFKGLDGRVNSGKRW